MIFFERGDKAVSDNWISIDTMREVDHCYSGTYYSEEWIRDKHLENRKGSGMGMLAPDGVTEIRRYNVSELSELMKDEEGKLYYRHKEMPLMVSPKEFKTQYGVFKNNDQGEFGGWIKTPKGKKISGNFNRCFELGIDTYFISTLSHLGLDDFALYRFTGADNYKKIYSSGLEALISLDTIEDGEFEIPDDEESLSYGAMYINDETAYILLKGGLLHHKIQGKGRFEFISRLLKIKDGNVEVLYDVNHGFGTISDMIVTDEYMAVATDKMVTIVDFESKKERLLTFISKEAEQEILQNNDFFLY